MKTSKISAVIAKVIITKKAFKLHFRDNQIMIIDKNEHTANFNPQKGQTLTLGLHRGMLCELFLDNQVIFKQREEDLLRAVPKLQETLAEDAKKSAIYKELPMHKVMISKLPTIMQHRILILQMKYGKEFRLNHECDEIKAMYLAVEICKIGWENDFDSFMKKIPSLRDEIMAGAGKMTHSEVSFAFALAKAYKRDVIINERCNDFEKNFSFLEFSQVIMLKDSNHWEITLEDIKNYCLTKKIEK